jgi:hypothetical protein
MGINYKPGSGKFNFFLNLYLFIKIPVSYYNYKVTIPFPVEHRDRVLRNQI